jgi:hypothetical protein
MFKQSILLAIALGISTSAWSANARQAEIDSILNVMETQGASGKIHAVQPLMWLGISDPAVYDPIAKELKEYYPKAAKEKVLKKLTISYCRALSYSGQDKYKATVQEVADKAHKKIAKHCASSLEDFAKYQKWNPIITGKKNVLGDPTKTAAARYYNMIDSGDLELARLGLKRTVHENKYSEPMLELVKKQLMANYQKPLKDKTELDAVIWMAKVLAETGETRFYETLNTVAEGAENRKLKKKVGKWAAGLM